MLSKSQIRFLKTQAHALHPLVIIGANGLSDAVHKEIDHTLTNHELIKVKLGLLPDDEQQTMIDAIIEKETAQFVQKIGHTAIFYRLNTKNPKISLPKK